MWKCRVCKEYNGDVNNCCRKCDLPRNYTDKPKVDKKKNSSHRMEYEVPITRRTDGVKPSPESDHEYDYIQDLYSVRECPLLNMYIDQDADSSSDWKEKQVTLPPFRPPLPAPTSCFPVMNAQYMSSAYHPESKDNTRIRNVEDALQMATLYGRRNENEIRLVMVGKTGTGKSATGNTILGKAGYFESKLSGKSITSECKRGECSQAGRKIVVIDTPGLFDTNISADRISKEIISCVNMTTPGPHAFLLILQIGRYTEEEIETFNRLFNLFGEGMGNFAILSFTRLDELEQEDRSVEDFLKDSDDLVQLLARCNNQYIAFDNKASKKKKTENVENLLTIVDSIVDKNGGRYYTNKMYKEAEAALQRKIKEVEEEKARQKQKEINRIESKFAFEIETMTEKNKKLAEQVSDKEDSQRCIQTEKEKVQQELLNMKDEMAKIDKKHNRDLYQRIQQEKDEKEKQAKALEEKDKQFVKILKTFENQQTEMNARFKDMEEKRQLELSEAKEDHNKIMTAEIQRIIDGNNLKYDEMMAELKSKDRDNENLQKCFKQQTATLEARLTERDKRHKEEYEELKQENENLKEKIKDKGCVIS